MMNEKQVIVLALLAVVILNLFDKRLGVTRVNPDPVSVNVLECTYVRELMDDGLDEIEAMQNMDCCVDMNCPFHRGNKLCENK